MIGDSPADVIAANRAGVRFLGFENPHVDDNQELREVFPGTIVEHLDEIRAAWSEVVSDRCGTHSVSGESH
jgi:phosphoglycolate phosphatase-like HAD superfamily hydrolase